MKKTKELKSASTVRLLEGGRLRIGSALLPNTNGDEFRFRVAWKDGRMALILVKEGGVETFHSNPYAKSPMLSLASSLRIQGVNWKDIPRGTYPASRRGDTIVVEFDKQVA